MAKKNKSNNDPKTRSPICVVMGHVDHGKSSILDHIRGSSVVSGEAGAITQAIGASIIPLDIIKKRMGGLLQNSNANLEIPGLLFIDTPGHEAFTNLRKRGGMLADIAIVVIDIREGFKPQTLEAIELLKHYKTPFIIAANKIDLLTGWRRNDPKLLPNVESQEERVKIQFETKLYEIVGQMSENFGLSSDRFDRVSDYTQQIAIVPTSAYTGEGISEMLMVLVGLTQKFLSNNLFCDVDGLAKGTILEVKESKGLGTTMDVILYDGCLSVNDIIVMGSTDKEPIVTKVRALFEPDKMSEMRDKKAKFKSIKKVVSATGVKVAAPNIDNVIAGMPIESADVVSLNAVKEKIQSEVDEIVVATDDSGIILKADTLGSLEALSGLVRDKGYTIIKAEVGDISKKDIMDGEANLESNPLDAIILGFNIQCSDELKSNTKVKVLTHPVVYSLLESFDEWIEQKKSEIEAKEIGSLERACKIHFIPNCTFRQNNPAVIGIEVVGGILKVGTTLMNKNGERIGVLKQIQLDKKNKVKAEEKEEVAISLQGPTVGRQINENEYFYSFMSEQEFLALKENKKHLSEKEIDALREIAEIMRKDNPTWGLS